MKTSLKTGFAQIFSCCPPKMGDSKIWSSPPPPLRPPGPYAPLNETKKDKLFLRQLRGSYLLRVRKKIYPFLELVEDKPHFLPPVSDVCHA